MTLLRVLIRIFLILVALIVVLLLYGMVSDYQGGRVDHERYCLEHPGTEVCAP